jgi:hypothetical protein
MRAFWRYRRFTRQSLGVKGRFNGVRLFFGCSDWAAVCSHSTDGRAKGAGKDPF